MKGDGKYACRKISYATRGEARHALREINKKRGNRGLVVYRCERCSLWHHGRGGKSRKRQLTRKNQEAYRGPTD